ncbi:MULTISPECIES: ParA family protein [Pseudomonas]|uniref:ParA family protein n=1 Tax=Pseudomonas TaxID=286 RepID=UPI0030DA9EAB
MTKAENADGLAYADFSALQFAPQFAADSLGISHQTLKNIERDHNLEIRRRAAGSVPVRVYSPQDLFQIARIRREKGQLKGLARTAIISTFVPKGGTAKTTVTVNLGIYLSLAGLKVLIVDNDPQADSTSSFGYDPDLSANELEELGVPRDRAVEGHIGNLLGLQKNQQPNLDEVLKKPLGEFGPHLITAEESLEDLDVILRAANGSDFRYGLFFQKALKGAIEGVDLSSYDAIIIDNAPSSSLLTRNSMVASDFLICPIRMDRFSMRALNRLSEKLEAFKNDFNRSPEVFILPTMYIKNRPRIQANVAKLESKFPGKVSEAPLYSSEDYIKSLEDLTPLLLWKAGGENSIGAMRSVFASIHRKLRDTVGSA